MTHIALSLPIGEKRIFNYKNSEFLVSGLEIDLLLGGIFTFFICFLINNKIFLYHISFFVSFVKSFLPLFYFAFFYQGRFHLYSDDTKYLSFAKQFLNSILYNDVSILSVDYRAVWHLITTIFFSISLYIYGNNYWSPIYLSIIFSCLSGVVLYRFFRDEIGDKYAKLVALFFLLGPYTIAWTSIVALREALVSFLLIIFIKHVWEIIERKRKFTIIFGILFILNFFCIFNVRFYLPIFVLLSAFIYFLMKKKAFELSFKSILKKPKLIIASILIGGVTYLINLVGGVPVTELYSLAAIPGRFISLVFGPIPERLSNEYIFLLLPACVHLALFAPSIFYWKAFVEASDFNRFLFINITIACFVMSFFGLNIRHRYQYEFIVYYIELFMLLRLLTYGKTKIRLF